MGEGLDLAELERQLFGCSLSIMKDRLLFRRSLERAWNLIEDGFNNPELSLSEVSRHCGVSRNHLNVLLNKETGYSFHEILSRFRLLQAARLMVSRDYTLLEVSLETGFGNISSLERQVRRILGTSPRQLRNSLNSKHLSGWNRQL